MLIEARFEANARTYAERENGIRALVKQFESIDACKASETDRLRTDVADRQRDEFLEMQFLYGFDIPGIGPTRMATLAAHGIETAADISYQRVRNASGFGDVLAKELVARRRQCEARFRFEPWRAAVLQCDVDAIKVKFMHEQRRLYRQLNTAPNQLNELSVRIRREVDNELGRLHKVAALQSQARADWLAAEGMSQGSFYPWPVVVAGCILFPIVAATLLAV